MRVTENVVEQEFLRVRGDLKIELFGPDGALKETREMTNLVVTVGKGVIANRLLSAPTLNAMTHIGVGTSATAPAAGDTDLTTPLVRQALTSSIVTGNTIQYIATLAAGVGTGTLAEAGIFNAAAAAQMLAHTAITTPVVKGAGDSMTITWNVTIS